MFHAYMALEDKDPPLVTVTQTAPADRTHTVARADTGDNVQLKERDSKRYEFIAEHGRGGLGRVMRTRDRDLRREVAIKEILNPGGTAEARFIREAMITARLEHPGIVPVHDAGRWSDGTPFYSMKLVSGQPLKQLIQETTTYESRLALLPNVIAVAEAIAYAHELRIIHRDLKPSNIIIGAFGETVVIDWGLAKDLSLVAQNPALNATVPNALQSDDPTLTALGSVMGTPAFMPPEQAKGEEVDERADVYALGAILYHVLTGTSPYSGITSANVLASLLAGPPTPLHESEPRVPEDLATIVSTAMNRDPKARYASATQMAHDLRRYQTGQLVGAHVYSKRELLVRWLRQHRTVVGAGLIALAMIAFTVIASFSRILAARNEAYAQRARAEDRTRDAQAAVQALELKKNDLILSHAAESLDRDPSTSLAWLQQLGIDGRSFPAAYLLAAQAASRPIAVREFAGFGANVSELQFSPDSRRLLSIAKNDSIRVLDVTSGAILLSMPTNVEIAWLTASHDGSVVAFTDSVTSYVVLSLDTLAVSRPGQCPPPVSLISLSPSGRSIACISGPASTITIVDLHNSTSRVWPSAARSVGANTLSWSHDEQYLAAVFEDGSARLLNLEANDIRTVPHSALGPGAATIQALDAGAWLLTNTDGSVNVWDAKSSDLTHVRGPFTTLPFATASPDGKWFAYLEGTGDVVAQNVETLQKRVAPSHCADLSRIQISSDSSMLIAACAKSDYLLWRPETQEAFRLAGEAGVGAAAFGLSKEILATAGSDKLIRLWHVPATSAVVFQRREAIFQMRHVGGFITADGRDGDVSLFIPKTAASFLLHHGQGPVLSARGSSDGQWLITSGWDGRVKTWHLSQDVPVLKGSYSDHIGPVRDAIISEDGRLIASVGDDGVLVLRDSEGIVQRLGGHEGSISAVDISASIDPPTVISAGADGSIRQWSFDGRLLRVMRGHVGAVSNIAYLDAGRKVISTGWDGTVRLWDVASDHMTIIGRHAGHVRSLAISPDSGKAASAGDDGVLIIYDLRQGKAVNTLYGRRNVRGLAFSPSGDDLASVAGDSLWVWSPNQHRICVASRLERINSVIYIAESALLTASDTGTQRLWSQDSLSCVPEVPNDFVIWLKNQTTIDSPVAPQIQ